MKTVEYQKGLKELSQQIEKDNPGWIKERRKSYLCKEIIKHCKYLVDFLEWYQEATQRGTPFLIKYIIYKYAQYEKWERELGRIKGEYDYLNRKHQIEGITQEEIDRAREYPIGKIIEVGRNGMALCPAHEDHHPSLDCRNGFVFCYTCNFHGNVIDLYMKINNVNFKEAVEFLSGI